MFCLPFLWIAFLVRFCKTAEAAEQRAENDGGKKRKLISTWPYSSTVPQPWGWYNAQLWNAGSMILPDATGQGNDAVATGNVQYATGSGNGAAASIPYIYGDVTGTLAWPTGSIASTFTICSVTRYTQSNSANLRILQGMSTNWAHGHWLNRRGVGIYGNTWLTALDANGYAISVNIVTNWLVMCTKNSGNAPTNVLVDGTTSGARAGGKGSDTLIINNVYGSVYGTESSNWALSQVLIWQSALTDTQMAAVSTMLKQYLMTADYTVQWPFNLAAPVGTPLASMNDCVSFRSLRGLPFPSMQAGTARSRTTP